MSSFGPSLEFNVMSENPSILYSFSIYFHCYIVLYCKNVTEILFIHSTTEDFIHMAPQGTHMYVHTYMYTFICVNIHMCIYVYIYSWFGLLLKTTEVVSSADFFFDTKWDFSIIPHETICFIIQNKSKHVVLIIFCLYTFNTYFQYIMSKIYNSPNK